MSRLRSSGASTVIPCSTGVSWTAAGRSSSISGLVVWAKVVRRFSVDVVSVRNAGNARIVFASAVSRDAVAANRALLLRTKLCSVDGERLSAENTAPPSRSSVLVAALSRRRTVSTESTLVAKGYRLAKAALNCSPRLVSAIPPCCIQVSNARRVVGSNAPKI